MASSIGPEEVEGGGVGELVGSKLSQGFAAGGGPEFFAPFEPLIDLFDRRLDRAGGDRQARLVIGRVVHPRLLVGQVRQRVDHDLARIGGQRVDEVQNWYVFLVLEFALPDAPVGGTAIGDEGFQQRGREAQ